MSIHEGGQACSLALASSTSAMECGFSKLSLDEVQLVAIKCGLHAPILARLCRATHAQWSCICSEPARIAAVLVGVLPFNFRTKASSDTLPDSALRRVLASGLARTVKCPSLTRLLIAAGADVHAQRNRALCVAAYHNCTGAMQALLQAGANSRTDFKPLILAAHRGNMEAVEILLAHCANPKATAGGALAAALKEGHASVIRVLVDAGASLGDKHARLLLKKVNLIDVLKALLQRRATTTASSSSGYTAPPRCLHPALLIAVRKGHVDAVRALLSACVALPGPNAATAALQQHQLLNEFEAANAESVTDPWRRSSPWILDWVVRAVPDLSSPAQNALLIELAVEDMDSARRWANPSPWLYGWIDRMRDTLPAVDAAPSPELQHRLLSEVEAANAESATDPWGRPSRWMSAWLKRATPAFTAQTHMLRELAYANAQSVREPWVSPSPWLSMWVGRMRATMHANVGQ